MPCPRSASVLLGQQPHPRQRVLDAQAAQGQPVGGDVDADQWFAQAALLITRSAQQSDGGFLGQEGLR